MNAFELFHADGRRTGVWACGQCRHVHQNEEIAALCCEPRLCEECKQPAAQHRTLCESCLAKAQEARTQKQWDAARKLPAVEYDGPVYDDDADEFHDSFDAFHDQWLDEREPGQRRPRIYACLPFGLQFDAGRIVEGLLDRHHEDAYEEIPDGAIGDLQKLLDDWDAQHGPTSYAPDYETAVVWPPDPPDAGLS